MVRIYSTHVTDLRGQPLIIWGGGGIKHDKICQIIPVLAPCPVLFFRDAANKSFLQFGPRPPPQIINGRPLTVCQQSRGKQAATSHAFFARPLILLHYTNYNYSSCIVGLCPFSM